MNRRLMLMLLSLLLAACRASEQSTTTAPVRPDKAKQSSAAPTTDADYDLQFIDTIIQHHEMAVQMARMAESEASDPKLKEFGRKVAEDQTSEIARLRSWREQWYHAAPKAVNTQLAGAESLNIKMSHTEPATGHELDMKVVEMMIPHHQGAIEMAREALQRAQRQELKQFAQETIDKQQKEIQQLQQWKSSMTPAATSGLSTALPSIESRLAQSILLTRVEPKKVCMINERVFANDQIPVPVGDRVYYGCCEMCKTALAQNADKRTAIDPVSRRTVDKALAVVGADKAGKVYYFENETNLRAFRPAA